MNAQKMQPRQGFLARARSREIAAGHQPKFMASDTAVNTFPSGGATFYDGAIDSSVRSSFPSFPLTARREFTKYNRRAILRKIRALEANLGLIPRMKGQVGKYSVGRGIFPEPQTSHPAWNEESAMKFDDWANNRFICDVAGAMTFWERQNYHARTFFAESESFDALISSSFSGAPQLQLFDNSEIGNPYNAEFNAEYIDGVKANASFRPISYLTAVQNAPGIYAYAPIVTREIAAADMIHLIRRKRANQLRGISAFAPGINCAIDKLDLRALTTAAAKLHEALGIVVKKKGGEAGKVGLGSELKKILDGDGNVTQVNEEFLQGAGIQYLALDEELTVVSSDRPTQNLMEFGNELIRDICLGAELNFEIVWNLMTLGGATARIALADAQWFFDGIQDAINEMFNQRVWVWWCASMMKSGQLSRCNDPRWWVCHWQGPPKLTADAGRTMKGEIEALGSGLNSWADYYSRSQGRFWKEPIKQRIEELRWGMQECARQDPPVPFEFLYSLKPGTAMVSVNGTDSTAP